MTDKNLNILDNVRKVHLIGVGGIGMSGIAEFLIRKGYIVSGSDLFPSQITERLKKLGVNVFVGHNAENIQNNVDLVVYSSAVKENNCEFTKANDSGIKMVKRAVILGELVNDLFLISVSGTHGKTSTTAMIAKVLIDNNLDPTVFAGGNIDFLDNGTSRIGAGKYAVVEADEYDRSFLTLKSDVAVITNIELDHTDIYKTLSDLKNSFQQFINNSKPGYKIVACGDDENILDVIREYDAKDKYLYGLKENNQNVINKIENKNEKISFSINNKEIKLKVPGIHNALNSIAAYLASGCAGISFENYAKSIVSFSGVKRRLELKFSNDIKVYDDYAHHPTEVAASFDAIKNITKNRIITVFQPHTFTRTRDLYKEFAYALKDNDVVILADIYPARETAIEGVSSGLIFDELKKLKKKDIYYLKSFEIINSTLKNIIKKNDTILFQGAGNIMDLCDLFINNYLKSEE
jgi:UDP-N-acetylmuramate--alanine ligase